MTLVPSFLHLTFRSTNSSKIQGFPYIGRFITQGLQMMGTECMTESPRFLGA